MDMAVQKQIQQVKFTYDKKKSDVLSQIEVNKGQRFEHISNKDQNVVKFNQAKYSYIHKKWDNDAIEQLFRAKRDNNWYRVYCISDLLYREDYKKRLGHSAYWTFI